MDRSLLPGGGSYPRPAPSRTPAPRPVSGDCVDIFTVDTNAQMDNLGLSDVYLDTDTNSSCVDVFTVDSNARMYDLCLSDVYLDTDSNSSCFGIFTVDTNAQMDDLGLYDVSYAEKIRKISTNY